ncbi:pilin [Patescibacteria group bacterium]|nr:pilin [Patescibacteria group bacterium]MBU1472205.1 pilin [Patescibacteria group bacterium]MBU2459599.1 pilin [Patescibacteria group bacterium]MBU2544160.1 pilin [Patescibacteria group bacterium]
MVSCEKITSQNCGKLDASCDPNDSTAPCCSTLTCNPQTKKCDITTTTNNIFCADNKSVNTAIGCIPTDPQGFITKFLSLAVGLGGGIAFLLIIFGGFQIMTSAGNPEKLAAGKELVSAAISGLLLIVFSLFLLRLIGYTIFKIPGFG